MLMSKHIALLHVLGKISVEEIPAKPIVVIKAHIIIAGSGHKACLMEIKSFLCCTQRADILLNCVIGSFLR